MTTDAHRSRPPVKWTKQRVADSLRAWVVSYDMPWNPQRLVQRNGRVIRLMSPHDEVLLTTMLPEPGDLERLLGLEARIRTKVRAAGVYGMESQVIEGPEEAELRAYADRLAAGDASLLDEAEEESGAFVGEALRRLVERAIREGEVARVQRLPWGIGAAFRQAPGGQSTGAPGVFFAVRTPASAGGEPGRRHWRYVETASGDLLDNDLEILRRIDPTGAHPLDSAAGGDLEGAWQRAADDIVAAHNARVDVRAEQEAIGPRQRWALEVLRDPGVAYAPGAEEAEEALSVGRSSTAGKALGDVHARVESGELTLDQAATQIRRRGRGTGPTQRRTAPPCGTRHRGRSRCRVLDGRPPRRHARGIGRSRLTRLLEADMSWATRPRRMKRRSVIQGSH